ncbi:MAG TPA: FAD/NAD(P)-binding protein [Roseateles sp.]|uniref:FAD/NAD(P)-binding protein n=1 Tax=Roseateles sp. TaxID=1971397 RepID=UPI002ED8C8AB
MGQHRSADDRALGMDRPISRRDFLDGMAQAAGAAALSVAGSAHSAAPLPNDGVAAPRRQGLRGFENAAMEAGHAVRDGKGFGASADTGEHYDLAVVGAGMSGLAAAWSYRQQMPGARVLLLDGCDDFGGHARRVEFDVGGRQLLVCGGTQELWNLSTFSPESLRMLADIGIDRERYRRHVAADRDAFAAAGLRPGTFYNREDFGSDRLVLNPSMQGITAERLRAHYDTTPLPEPVKLGMVRYFTDATDHMAGLAVEEKIRRLRQMSFTDYLLNVARIPPEAVAYHVAGWGNDMDNSSAGYDTMSAWAASRSYPQSFAGLGLPKVERRSNVVADVGELIQFPDGNAGVARLLIRHLVPGSLPGSTAEDSIRAQMRYDRLDRPGSDVRIRLSSMVVRAAHVGDPGGARAVDITYVQDGRAQRVRAGAVVMACFNAMVPYLVPDLPVEQKAALSRAVRKAQLRSFVAIRDWKAFQKLGVYGIGSRGMPFAFTTPWVMPEWGGAYENARTPDEPAVLFMNLSRHVLDQRHNGLPPRERWKAARATLQAMTFESLERDIRSQLNRMLGGGGFDAARDIAGITVCRWAHGYAGGANELYDAEDAPWLVGRQRFGRIAIANSDAAATSLTNAAFAQGHRAVMELVNDVVRPVYDFRWSERDGRM